MATEERRIIFSNSELIEALLLFCIQSKRDLSFSRNKQLSFGNSPNLSVTASGTGSTGKEMLFHENEIAAALILFANKLNIPIAKKARKSIELSQGKVVFVLTI